MLPYIITAVVSIIITALIVWFAAASYQKKSANSKIGNAEEKARGIIDEAVKTAEEKKRESMLEIKEESIKAKNDLDKEIKERRNEISVMSVVSFRRKKMSTRSSKLSRSVKPDLQLRKRNSRSRRLKYQSLTSSVYRNLKESLD